MNKEKIKKYFHKLFAATFSILFLIMILLSSEDEILVRSIAFFVFSYFYYIFLKSIIFEKPYIEGIRNVKNDGKGLADYMILMTFLYYMIILIIIVFIHLK